MKAEAFLPLTESTYLILLSLVHPMHGYGIMQNVRDMTGGNVIIGPGTLYGALSTLQSRKLIMPVDDGLSTRGDRGRKAYALTVLGLEVVSQEQRRLRCLAELGAQQLNALIGDGRQPR